MAGLYSKNIDRDLGLQLRDHFTALHTEKKNLYDA